MRIVRQATVGFALVGLACSGLGLPTDPPVAKPNTAAAPQPEDLEHGVDGDEDQLEDTPEAAWTPPEQAFDDQGHPRPVRPEAPPRATDLKTGKR